jgi:hypothetical protein
LPNAPAFIPKHLISVLASSFPSSWPFTFGMSLVRSYHLELLREMVLKCCNENVTG